MNIKLICIGKTDDIHLETLIQEYVKRINFYIRFEIEIIPDIKNRKSLNIDQQKTKEGALIMQKIQTSDWVVLLDDKGKEMTSTQFSDWMSKKMLSGLKQLVFIIGGPYGFSKQVYENAHQKLSLSKMTFSHQMVRLFFTEQVYRAFTILNNEPYHHE
jgi:23S rRNA (pseudouridine1915-N3)-methyltransferase